MPAREQIVSTIIPVYNRPEMLVRAVNSVVTQTHRPIEIIIVDDGSTDHTLATAKQLAEQYQFVRTVSVKNAGPGMAREVGRKLAIGHFIQYLDSDDVLLPEKFAKQVSQLNQNTHCDVCYCQTSLQRLNDTPITSWKRTAEKIDTIIPAMLASRWWGTSTPLYTRSVVDLAGPWQSWINEEDWEYDCRIGFKSKGLAYVPEVLSIQIEHQQSRLSDDGAKDQSKLRSRVKARAAIIGQCLNHPEAIASKEFTTQLKFSFLLARQCGAAGLPTESRDLFKLVEPHLKQKNVGVLSLNLYKVGAALLGWALMGKLAERLDRLRA